MQIKIDVKILVEQQVKILLVCIYYGVQRQALQKSPLPNRAILLPGPTEPGTMVLLLHTLVGFLPVSIKAKKCSSHNIIYHT